jgi:hypothetical protein
MGKELENILKAIGRTPLVKLNNITRGIKSVIYVKTEMLNPGGSVKDRIGLAMVEAAEREGKLKPGGTIVEATAGNTGVGLALVAAIKGYRCIFVLPDKMSREKINLLKAGAGDLYLQTLGPWKEMLAAGLTTFAEKPDPTRSDYHAWSASPMYDFLTIVCGINPAGSGFRAVHIEPNIEGLEHVEAKMPHPLGEIRVEYRLKKSTLVAEVELPMDLEGTFTWKETFRPLKQGHNQLTLEFGQ